jgi:hypothetical protein
MGSGAGDMDVCGTKLEVRIKRQEQRQEVENVFKVVLLLAIQENK